MGIPRIYPQTVHSLKGNHVMKLNLGKKGNSLPRFSAVAVDFNSMLHQAMLKCWDLSKRDQIFRNLESILKKLRKNIQVDHLGLFIDGVPPRAKIREQISRRRPQPQKARMSCFDPNLLNRLEITSGTQLMDDLSNFVRRFLSYEKGLKSAHLSDHKEAGEGEVKMIKWLKDLNLSENSNVAICGEDGDLLPIAIAATHSTQLNVKLLLNVTSREAKLVDSREFLRKFHNGKFNSNTLNFILSALLFGNDYLPRFQLRHECPFDAMRSANYPDIVDSQTLGLRCSEFLKFICALPDLNGFDTQKTIEFQSPSSEGPLVAEEIPTDSELCERYLKGLAWNIHMYIRGECPDQTFEFPWNVPTRSQLVAYLNEQIKNNPASIISSFQSDARPISTDELLLLIMPRWADYIMPPHLRHAIHDESPLHFWFPKFCDECDAFKEELSKTHAQRKKCLEEKNKESFDELGKVIRSAEKKYSHHREQCHPKFSPPYAKIRSFVQQQKRKGHPETESDFFEPASKRSKFKV